MNFIRSCALAMAALTVTAAAAKEYRVYVGTYTTGKSKGIYTFKFDTATGKTTPVELAAETTSPSFLAIHPNGRYLYAVNEVGNFGGVKSGSVTAYSIDPATGKLTTLNAVSSKGTGPCYVSVDGSGRNVLVANYGSGSVAAMPIGTDGKLQEAASAIQHQGSGANKRRQAGPHAHYINASRDNRFVVASDLGLDQVLVYKFDAATGTLTPNEPPAGKVAPGSGPRHFAFHPNGRAAYVINEMALTITAFDWDAKRGVLTEKQTVKTVPEGVSGDNHSTAQIVVHPNGRFVYGSNRGHDSIAVFAINKAGTLSLVEHVPTQGSTPRNFDIDPTGTFLFAANQRSDNVVLFRIDQKTGKLTPTGDVLEIRAPVCIRFLPVR